MASETVRVRYDVTKTRMSSDLRRGVHYGALRGGAKPKAKKTNEDLRGAFGLVLPASPGSQATGTKEGRATLATRSLYHKFKTK